MSENKTILTTRRFELWWRKAQGWFAAQFAPIVDGIDNTRNITAKETTAQEIKELIINEGIEHANEYAAEIREIIGDWSNE